MEKTFMACNDLECWFGSIFRHLAGKWYFSKNREWKFRKLNETGFFFYIPWNQHALMIMDIELSSMRLRLMSILLHFLRGCWQVCYILMDTTWIHMQDHQNMSVSMLQLLTFIVFQAKFNSFLILRDVYLVGSTQGLGRPLLTLEIFLCSRLTPLETWNFSMFQVDPFWPSKYF